MSDTKELDPLDEALKNDTCGKRIASNVISYGEQNALRIQRFEERQAKANSVLVKNTTDTLDTAKENGRKIDENRKQQNEDNTKLGQEFEKLRNTIERTKDGKLAAENRRLKDKNDKMCIKLDDTFKENEKLKQENDDLNQAARRQNLSADPALVDAKGDNPSSAVKKRKDEAETKHNQRQKHGADLKAKSNATKELPPLSSKKVNKSRKRDTDSIASSRATRASKRLKKA